MSDGNEQVKIEKQESFHETDSFDEPKGNPINEEPIFKTAAGARIDVKQESIDKSRKLLNDQKEPKSFNSPLLKTARNNNKAFVSPFRGDGPSTSSLPPGKRPLSRPEKNGAPPAKKAAVEEPRHKKERREIHADVLRVSRVDEKDQIRIILQESSHAPLILGTISYRRGKEIKYGDRLYIDAEIERKDKSGATTEIYLLHVLKRIKNGAKRDIRRHSFAKAPYCTLPKFIHEIQDESAKHAVLQINILDLKFEIYRGCSACKRVWKDETSRVCSQCKEKKTESQIMVFSRMRVSDFSGQIFINVATRTMEKFLEIMGYKGIEQWFRFQDPNERLSYLFRPLMIEVEKNKNKEWDCIDVAEVEWDDYADYLEKIQRKH